MYCWKFFYFDLSWQKFTKWSDWCQQQKGYSIIFLGNARYKEEFCGLLCKILVLSLSLQDAMSVNCLVIKIFVKMCKVCAADGKKVEYNGFCKAVCINYGTALYLYCINFAKVDFGFLTIPIIREWEVKMMVR